MPVDSGRDIADVLGLEAQSNRLRPYTSRWADLYDVEARSIQTALGSLALEVQHVGSTAVPGIMAKPILDIVIGVKHLEHFAQCIAPLAALGYEHAPWAGLERDEVFGKAVTRTHLIHVVEFGRASGANTFVFAIICFETPRWRKSTNS